MSFRRTKSEVAEERKYRDFVQSNAEIFQASGVPSSIYQSRTMFDDLLMHGDIDHHPDPTQFFVGQLSDDQQEALAEVIVRYLSAGYPDPGIVLFKGFIQDEIARRMKRDD